MSMDDRFKTIESQLEALERQVKALQEKNKQSSWIRSRILQSPHAGEVAFTHKPKKAVKSE